MRRPVNSDNGVAIPAAETVTEKKYNKELNWLNQNIIKQNLGNDTLTDHGYWTKPDHKSSL
jgi:hypothetical protein